MIIGLQFLRFLAAFFVVLTHSLGEFNWTKPFGDFGVDIFFIISGFIIYTITKENKDNFLKKRMIRLIPMYWLFSILVTILSYFRPDLLNSTKFDLQLSLIHI